MNASFRSFEDLENFFASIASPGIRPGLERIAALLSRLNGPEKDFPAIHIVGTNGKGSTAAFSERILRESGYRTALYTSPHLESPEERLFIDGAPVPLEEWEQAALWIDHVLKEDQTLRKDPPTFFEIVTATAFLLCSQKTVEIAVVEAGLGGRLDATNLLGDVVLTLITSISMDHMEFLGKTLEDIAGEKFAVMRKGVSSFFSGSPYELIPLFQKTAQRLGSLSHVVSREVGISNTVASEEGVSFDFSWNTISLSLETSMHGLYQIENCALALSGILSLSSRFPAITKESILRGILHTRWPGRFEILRKNPPLVLDGGHNPDGIRRLAESITVIYGKKKPTIVYACMKDKDFKKSLDFLRPVGEMLICTSVPRNERTADPLVLAACAKNAGWDEKDILVVPDPLVALQIADEKGAGTVCCGSLYFIGYLRKNLFHGRKENSY